MSTGSFRGRLAFLSNFHLVDITDAGILYPSVEHAYQANKTWSVEIRLAIAGIPYPDAAKRMGAALKGVRPDWEVVKIDVMRGLLQQKFKRPDLAKLLAATWRHELVEVNSWGDTFWGVCNGVGENHLGKLLQEIRDTL